MAIEHLNRRQILFSGLAVSSGLISTSVLTGCGSQTAQSQRIISIGGDLTEIIHALDRLDNVVARDSTSMYPASVTDLPDIGYVRSLGAEGILSLSPSLIIASSEAGPPEVIDQIKATGIKVVTPEEGHSVEALKARIMTIGDTLSAEKNAKTLIAAIEEDMRRHTAKLETLTTKPKVLFLLNGRDGSPMAAGKSTAADAMITLAGGHNVFDSHNGYKAYSFEGLADAAPDFIMMMDHSLAQMGGVAGIKSHPAIGLTPAAKTGNIIAKDGLFLLGFGPRLPEAVKYLSSKFHPDI